MPGVSGAALVNTPPLGGQIAKRSLEIEAYVAPPAKGSPLFWLNIVSPDYFRVLGIRLVEGSGLLGSRLLGQSARRPRQRGDRTSILGRPIGDRPALPLRRRNATGGRSSASWPTCAPTTSSATEPEWIEGTAYVPWSPKATAGGRARAGADDDRRPDGLRRRRRWMRCFASVARLQSGRAR